MSKKPIQDPNNWQVPKNIRRSLHRIAELSTWVEAHMASVEGYLERQGFDIEALRDGSGCGLEEFLYGNDITDEFCVRLEVMKNGSSED